MPAPEFKFCPHCGSTLGEKQEEGHTLKHCHACNTYTHYDNPKGVAVLLIAMNGGLVLVKRAVAPRAGKWALPAGFINKGEGPRQAAVREGEEETGLKVEIISSFNELPVPGGNQFLVFYLAKVVDGQLTCGSDAADVQVFPLDQLPSDIAFPLHSQVISEWAASQGLTAAFVATPNPVSATTVAASSATTAATPAAPAAPAAPTVAATTAGETPDGGTAAKS